MDIYKVSFLWIYFRATLMKKAIRLLHWWPFTYGLHPTMEKICNFWYRKWYHMIISFVIFIYSLYVNCLIFLAENVSGGKRGQIERLQDRAAQELRLHVDDTYPDTPDRFSRLLLKLPTLKALQPQVHKTLAVYVVSWKSILVLWFTILYSMTI